MSISDYGSTDSEDNTGNELSSNSKQDLTLDSN